MSECKERCAATSNILPFNFRLYDLELFVVQFSCTDLSSNGCANVGDLFGRFVFCFYFSSFLLYSSIRSMFVCCQCNWIIRKAEPKKNIRRSGWFGKIVTRVWLWLMCLWLAIASEHFITRIHAIQSLTYVIQFCHFSDRFSISNRQNKS